MKELTLFSCVTLLLAFGANLIQGQESPQVDSSLGLQETEEIKKTPLGVRQQRIKRMIVELENQFSELARTLQKDNPEQAEKLVDAFKSSKEMLLEKRMDEITELLDLSKLDSAGEEQKKTIDDVKSLIEFLLKDDEEVDRIKEEIKKLQEWKDAIDGLIKDENKLKEESEIHTDKDQALEDLNKQIGQLKELIDRQDELKSDTEKESLKGIDGLDEIAEKQQELRGLTESLRNELEGDKKDGPQSKQSKGSEQDSDQDDSPGADPLRDAEEDQKWAEKKLEEGKGKLAAEAEKEALDNLNEALEQLEKERDRIKGLGSDELEKLAKDQSSTANDAGQLSEKMKDLGDSDEDASEQQDPLKDGQKRAQEAVESAQSEMGKASESLAQGSPGGASKNQEQALEDLEKAKEEVEKQLEELQQDQKMEALVQLEQMFIEMLERQEEATAKVLVLDEKRNKQDGKLRRADRIELRSVELLERDLSEKSKEAEGLLVDDGASVVVRNVVEGMKNDLIALADRVDANETGSFVQRSQKEVEMTLKELIDAVKLAQQMQEQQEQQQQQQEQQQQEQQQQEQPLLPPSAELKLLRLTQLRINRRTIDFDGEIQGSDKLNDVLMRQVRDATLLQKKITESARELAARGQPPLEAEID
ncbi:MAG: hypothetical protein EVB09_09095 [Verrucomicrobiaceae bacterium]|nr:MAG: hypothetical protein EVB09_09095 [Verrucomicrobiaceae bacterium]